ncbi:Crp/Fnr family transcriptional regulator (plasmid) [Acaryochloris sp. 'Moss Beach']|nr:Crp/Fnr family transcriptional regulator [Acaryochloris marina S15]UJB72519.1 Crp/Fnr family transcriptional regulator [Acaryochloris sp. 'Moss Beach']
MWILRQGLVVLSTFFSDGGEASLSLVYPDMPFGLPLTQVDPYEAIALTDVALLRLNQIEVENSPSLAQEILQQITRRLQTTEALLVVMHHNSVSCRLQALLLLLTKEIGEQTPEGIRLGVRLSHQQLADLVGTTRVTVTKTLKSLRKTGWLSLDPTQHFILHESAVVDLQ